jgi:hypothetical protein
MTTCQRHPTSGIMRVEVAPDPALRVGRRVPALLTGGPQNRSFVEVVMGIPSLTLPAWQRLH